MLGIGLVRVRVRVRVRDAWSTAEAAELAHRKAGSLRHQPKDLAHLRCAEQERRDEGWEGGCAEQGAPGDAGALGQAWE